MKNWTIASSQKLKGTIEVPGDKSISHRAIIFGALSEGTTRVRHLLEGEDVLCTIEIFKNLGVSIQKTGATWNVKGKGIAGLKHPSKDLYCGNSGTTLRLLTGLFSGLPFSLRMTGDESLNKRPMGRVIKPLLEMGAIIEEVHEGERRFIVTHGGNLNGGRFSISVSSAQLKSALLLAGLSSGKKVSVREPSRSRDHSERMLKAFGADVVVKGNEVTLNPSPHLKAHAIHVPGDISSAAFFIVLGLIHPDPKSCIKLKNIGLNPTRTGILDVLKKMGGKIKITNRKILCGEPVGDLEVIPSRLKGVTIGGDTIPRLIDEIPIIAVAAAFASGKTKIMDADELRIKETDRIKAIATELPKYGVPVREFKSGLEITGGAKLHSSTAGLSYGDHRMAMSQAVLGAVLGGKTKVKDVACVQTSFPGFDVLMKKVGVSMSSGG